MDIPIPNEHPISRFFSEVVSEAFASRTDREDVRTYLTNLLIRFMHQDVVYGIQNSAGKRVQSIAEMLTEGDIRLNADSFEREREVHRHIGDFLLFWTGLFPERPVIESPFVDPDKQGSYSYFVASSFDYGPYRQESRTLLELSEGFQNFKEGLYVVRKSIPALSN